MKRPVPGLSIICSIVVIIIYFFLPGSVSFNQQVIIHGNVTNATRFLSEESQWHKWWPQNIKSGNDSSGQLLYDSYKYAINWKLLSGDSVKIENETTFINSLLNIIPLQGDTLKIQWDGQSPKTLNPFKKFHNYREQARVRKNIVDILGSMKLFLENNDAIYGTHIDQIMVKDTLLIARKLNSSSYPTTSEIYHAIGELREYIRKEGAVETHYPMLHISKEMGVYENMIAIPISKAITGNNIFKLKRMIPGKILITEVRGGQSTNDLALKKIENYMEDYQLLSPALPFQSLVTDRSKEPDSSKWITMIYYPVM